MKTNLFYGVAITLIFNVFCLEAKAQTVGDTFTTNDIVYEVTVVGTSSEVSTTNYTGSSGIVTIPSTVTDASTSFSYDVTSIGSESFSDDSLTSVTIPNSVTSIGGSAFFKNQITSVVIPNSVIIISSSAFKINNLTSVDIPSSVTSIGSYVFTSNNLTSVTIPSSVTSIPNYAFLDNSLTSVTIPNSVTSIGDKAFSQNLLTSITIPNSVTSIGEQAFEENELTSVTIPSSVTSIGVQAFNDNLLTKVIIGKSVASIGDYAFYENTTLTEVSSLNETPAILLGNVFSDKSMIDLTIPTGTTQAYIDSYWTGFNSTTASLALSILQTKFENTMSISTYPNPVNDKLTISLPTGQTLQEVTVFNLLGETIETTTNSSIDFSSVPKGIYTLKVKSTAGKIATEKIVKK